MVDCGEFLEGLLEEGPFQLAVPAKNLRVDLRA